MFMASWLLPAEACVGAASQAAAPAHCQGCPCDPDASCATGTIAATCATPVLPAMIAPAPSLDKALPAPAALRLEPAQRAVQTVPLLFRQPPPASSSSSVNIRFCSFQI